MNFLWKLGAAANSQRLKGKTPPSAEAGPAWSNTDQQSTGINPGACRFYHFLIFSLKTLEMPFMRLLR